jgi:hypothetical protein
MQDRPTAAELLGTLGEYLQGEVLPNVEGTLRYHTLVAANIVRILGREVDLGPAADAAELAALRALLDRPDEDLAALNARLHQRLLDPAPLPEEDEARIWAVLDAATRAKLAVNKPGYERYDMAAEVG